jgi:4-hydroxy 2-oxovalerate aldolase
MMTLLREYFKPMQAEYGWGTNPYYYLAGKYAIHPTYIQEMLSDSRFSEEDVLAAIDHLRLEGGKKFSLHTLDAARHFYIGEPKGKWSPKAKFTGRKVLLLGTGPGVENHRTALEQYINRHKPIVLALNTQSSIDAGLIDIRLACHPVRLLADCEAHVNLPQPLITPFSMLPQDVQESLQNKDVLDYGLTVKPNTFEFLDSHCTLPTSLVVAYALAVVTSGKAEQIFLAGFDGYGADDPRSAEMRNLLETYLSSDQALPLTAITPTRYGLPSLSVYAL